MSKKRKKEKIAKRNKRKKILIFTIGAAVLAIIIVLIVLKTGDQSISSSQNTIKQQTTARVFINENQTITLNTNGTFIARLAHDNNIDGTYSEANNGNFTIISFFYQDSTVNSRIMNNILSLPHEWEDSHGHGNEFKLR